ncbi:MAG: hypothetical protein M1839_004668 [Geoglossum umbratile]|nr:MAG: hypothetical protein M1839_004668 [Geoglossum umbratile]
MRFTGYGEVGDAEVDPLPVQSTRCHCKRRFTSASAVRALRNTRIATGNRLRAILSSTARKSHDPLRSSKPHKLAKLELLPMELLNKILMNVLDQTTESSSLCRCSRPKSDYETVRKLSLEHRVVNTCTLRSTCSAFHSWAIGLAFSGSGTEDTGLEVDFSNYEALKERFAASGSSPSRRLREDFPFLGNSSLTLYLGNPGQVSNIRLIIDMLRREDSDTTSIFGGTSFWDLAYSYSEPRGGLVDLAVEATALQGQVAVEHNQVGHNGETTFMCHPTITRYLQDMCIRLCHEDWLVHLDLLSIFAQRASSETRVQFPTRVFEVLPASVCESRTFVNILSSTKHMVFREFFGLNEDHMGEISRDMLKLQEIKRLGNRGHTIIFRIRDDITSSLQQECSRIWSNLSLESCETFGSVRRLKFHLMGYKDYGGQLQNLAWPRLNDAFMKTLTAPKFKDIVSVEVCGGFATSVTLGGLLDSLHHSLSTLTRLVYLPMDPGCTRDPERGVLIDDGAIPHHCQLLHRFPNLVTVELYCTICPAMFSCGTDRRSLSAPRKQHWKIQVPGPSDATCIAWRKEVNSSPSPTTERPRTLWSPETLRVLLESCRAAKNRDMSKNVIISPVHPARKLGVDDESSWELELELNLHRWHQGQTQGSYTYRVILQPLRCPSIIALACRTGEDDEGYATWGPDYKLEEEEFLLAWESREPWIAQSLSRSERRELWDNGYPWE